MKKSQLFTIAIICLTSVFGTTLSAQASTSNTNDQSWAVQSKEQLNDLTAELKQITSDDSLTEMEKSNQIQEKNNEIITLIDRMDVPGDNTKTYKFDAKTPINCTPIEDMPREKTSSNQPTKAEKNTALTRLNKAEESLTSQKLSGKINEEEYSEKLDRIQRAKMQIASI